MIYNTYRRNFNLDIFRYFYYQIGDITEKIDSKQKFIIVIYKFI